jgi:hypothetical protein
MELTDKGSDCFRSFSPTVLAHASTQNKETARDEPFPLLRDLRSARLPLPLHPQRQCHWYVRNLTRAEAQRNEWTPSPCCSNRR